MKHNSNSSFKLFRPVINKLGYEFDFNKCKQLKTRIAKTGPIKIFIYLYLYVYLLTSKFSKKESYPNNILFKFIAGNTILVFESEFNFKNAKIEDDNVEILPNIIYDTIVVGSGPGGSIAALKLLKKGENVLIVEKGKNYIDESVEHHSLTQTKLQFNNEGLNFCYGNIPIIYAEGSTYGGGSEVNSGLYFKLTGHYKEKFLELAKINKNLWDEKEKYVEKKLNVQFQPPEYSKNLVSSLIEGSKLNNLIYQEIPRWRTYNPESHQGMIKTYLQEAKELGLKRLTDTRVIKINNKDKSKISVKIEKNNKINFLYAKKVVLSSGTVSTPSILKKSSLLKDKIKFNLHPMTRCVVDYGSAVNNGDLFPPYQSWTGDYNYKFGYSVSTPPYLKATLASLGSFNSNVSSDQLVSYFSSTVLKESKGRIYFLLGRPIPFIKISNFDKENIKKGYKLLKETLRLGGAKNVWPNEGLSPISTVHIFGSLPINSNKDLDQNGALNTDMRIKVCDGSLLPIAPWGNPQAVIMVLNEILMDKWINKIYEEKI